MVAEYGKLARAGGEEGDGVLAATGLSTGPIPVRYTVITLPGGAGWLTSASVLPGLLTATARLPLYTKIPGPACGTVIANGALDAPPEVTTTVVLPGGTSGGISKLICAGLTNHNAAGVPLMATVTPESDVGKGTPIALAFPFERFVPKRAAMDCGAGPPVKLAPFTTAAMVGSGIAAGVNRRVALFAVSAM